MTSDALEKAKNNLALEKERIKLKEKLIRERENKKRAKRFQEIGRLAYQADIDQLDNGVLLGAFLEIRDHNNNRGELEAWRSKAEDFKIQQNDQEKTPMIISFGDEPSKEVKQQLSKLNFRWNNFRKEYQGYGNRSEVTKILGEIKHDLEVVQ